MIKKFRFLLPGFNVRPIEMEGAIGSIQLQKANDFIAIRRNNAEIFKSYVSKLTGSKSQKENGFCTWFGHSIIFPEEFKERDQLAAFLMDRGIETRPIISGNFLNQPSCKLYKFHFRKKDFRVSQEIEDRGFFIGLPTKDMCLNTLNFLIEKLLKIANY